MREATSTEGKKYLDVFCLMGIAILAILGTIEVSAILNSWLPGYEKAVSFVVTIGSLMLILPYTVIPAYYVFNPPPANRP